MFLCHVQKAQPRDISGLTLLPRMSVCFDSLGDAPLFSTCDAICGYWKNEVDETDEEKAAFYFRYGIYQFIRLPLGLKNCLASYPRATDIILFFVEWQLMKYEEEIVYAAGFKHQAASSLGRLATKLTDDSNINEDIPITAVTTCDQTGQDSHTHSTFLWACIWENWVKSPYSWQVL